MSSEAINNLAIGDPPAKSKAAQLLELLPAIEAAIRAGHSHASIHNHLVKSKGLDLTFRYYELTLGRLRKRVQRPSLQSKTRSANVSQSRPSNLSNPKAVNSAPVIEGTTSEIQNILFGSASDFFT